MQQAVARLRLAPSYLLIDAFSVPALSLPQSAIIHGDALVASIAAASIVAKVERDRLMREMHELYPGYGFDQNKGYGTAAHLEALHRLGPSPVHRRSFAPVRDLLATV
jgi:ribonuclease HII